MDDSAARKTIMETDAGGRFQMSEFYPEEFERICVHDAAGKEIWSEDPRKWPSTVIIRVVLNK
jgi:hypothetical protein